MNPPKLLIIPNVLFQVPIQVQFLFQTEKCSDTFIRDCWITFKDEAVTMEVEECEDVLERDCDAASDKEVCENVMQTGKRAI